MNVYLITDTHLNHANIATYCQRPKDFTELILKRWRETVQPEDLVIHLGDVILHKKHAIKEILEGLPGRKILVRGNHDRQWANTRWMEAGFQFACDGLKFRNCWLTHEPSTSLADGCRINVHGHLHNIWDGFNYNGTEIVDVTTGKAFAKPTSLNKPWQYLLALEYTDYRPVEFDKFVSHPEKYRAQHP